MTIFYQDEYVTLIHGDSREVLEAYDLGQIHCCVTSPPYWNLRNYGSPDQMGLESTLREYVESLRSVFDQVRSVTRKDGTLWLNLGDSMVKKQLCGIPWRCAFALQDAGWYLRSDIIWSKGNPMPESVTDRPTKAHEYIFLMAKSQKYYYDNVAIAEKTVTKNWRPAKGSNHNDTSVTMRNDSSRQGGGQLGNPDTRNRRSVWEVNAKPFKGAHFSVFPEALIEPCILAGVPHQVCAVCGAPWKRIVESNNPSKGMNTGYDMSNGAAKTTNPQTSAGLHRNGGGVSSSRISLGWQPTCTHDTITEPGTVLDPFGGAGTTGVVAKRFGRRAVLIEQNISYCEMAADRIAKTCVEVQNQTLPKGEGSV